MASLQKKNHRKTRLFAPSRPNYNDFRGPPDGNYVRFVDDLMAWAEYAQEQERQRAKGEPSALQSSEKEWGRTATKPLSKGIFSTAQGSVESAIARFQNKANRLQQQAQSPQQTGNAKPKSAKPGVMLLMLAVMVGLAIFKPSLLPSLIILWVFITVVRNVRKAYKSS